MQSIPLPVWKLGIALAAAGGVGASFYVWKDALKEDALLSRHDHKYAHRSSTDPLAPEKTLPIYQLFMSRLTRIIVLLASVLNRASERQPTNPFVADAGAKPTAPSPPPPRQ